MTPAKSASPAHTPADAPRSPSTTNPAESVVRSADVRPIVSPSSALRSPESTNASVVR